MLVSILYKNPSSENKDFHSVCQSQSPQTARTKNWIVKTAQLRIYELENFWVKGLLLLELGGSISIQDPV